MPPGAAPGPVLRPLAADDGTAVADVVAALGFERPGADRPRVVAAMIGSADGRATVAGRSVGLGHPADRALLRELRTAADAILVGAATVRAERYANLLDPEQREARTRTGRPEHPVVAILTRSGDVPWEVGLFAEPAARVAIHSPAAVRPPAGLAATVEVSRQSDPAAVLADLATRHDAAMVLCEGGPRLLRAVVAEGLLDDLMLTVAPLLAGGEGPTGLAGEALDPPARLALAGTWRADDHLFLHYRAAP